MFPFIPSVYNNQSLNKPSTDFKTLYACNFELLIVQSCGEWRKIIDCSESNVHNTFLQLHNIHRTYFSAKIVQSPLEFEIFSFNFSVSERIANTNKTSWWTNLFIGWNILLLGNKERWMTSFNAERRRHYIHKFKANIGYLMQTRTICTMSGVYTKFCKPLLLFIRKFSALCTIILFSLSWRCSYFRILLENGFWRYWWWKQTETSSLKAWYYN